MWTGVKSKCLFSLHISQVIFLWSKYKTYNWWVVWSVFTDDFRELLSCTFNWYWSLWVLRLKSVLRGVQPQLNTCLSVTWLSRRGTLNMINHEDTVWTGPKATGVSHFPPTQALWQVAHTLSKCTYKLNDRQPHTPDHKYKPHYAHWYIYRKTHTYTEKHSKTNACWQTHTILQMGFLFSINWGGRYSSG